MYSFNYVSFGTRLIDIVLVRKKQFENRCCTYNITTIVLFVSYYFNNLPLKVSKFYEHSELLIVCIIN